MQAGATQKPIGLEDLVEILWRRKWFLILPLFLGIGGGVATLHWLPPLYKSTTLILVEPQKVPEAYVKPTVTLDIEDRLSTLSQQVMSRTRLETIIRELDLYPEMREKKTMEEVVAYMRDQIEVHVKGKDAFRKAEDLYDFLGLPVLAVIPEISLPKRRG